MHVQGLTVYTENRSAKSEQWYDDMCKSTLLWWVWSAFHLSYLARHTRSLWLVFRICIRSSHSMSQSWGPYLSSYSMCSGLASYLSLLVLPPGRATYAKAIILCQGRSLSNVRYFYLMLHEVDPCFLYSPRRTHVSFVYEARSCYLYWNPHTPSQSCISSWR